MSCAKPQLNIWTVDGVGSKDGPDEKANGCQVWKQIHVQRPPPYSESLASAIA